MTKPHTYLMNRRHALKLGAGAGGIALLGTTALAQVEYKTPGVYVVELDTFPNSVVQVATSVPVFIGYTETSRANGLTLFNQPTRITSMQEFEFFFGGWPKAGFDFDEADPKAGRDPFWPKGVQVQTSGGPVAYDLKPVSRPFSLYDAMRHFYLNGGGDCYVVSIGNHQGAIEKDAIINALAILEQEKEPSMVLIPEAMLLSQEEAADVQNAMLAHCGVTTQSRIAILDIHRGYEDRSAPAGDPIEMFRTSLVSDGLSYGAAYYPWLRTSLTPPARATYESLSFEARKRLFDLVNADPGIYMPSLSARERSRALDLMEQIKLLNPLVSPREIPKRLAPEKLHAELLGSVPLYAEIMERLDRRPILLPPSAAMAAIMSKVDKDRGVWKAPANVSVMGVTELMVNIDNAAQVDLNTPISGKSVNAIRMFPTEGPLVWGARTLDGNSAEWRYINVRRTMIMIEQSIKAAISAYVFEPNDSDTWAAIKSMVSNYLTNLWSQGAFAGVTPSEAFNVSIGLGRTMTAQDILEDRLIVSVLVALVRPAEFIVLNFTQTQQRS